MHHTTQRAWGPLFTRRQCLQGLATLPFWPQAQAKSTSVQLASDWPAGRSPQGFWVSEKFDGVRAVWDGQRLCFRSGREIAAPDWFVRALPHHLLDGELWFGARPVRSSFGCGASAAPSRSLATGALHGV